MAVEPVADQKDVLDGCAIRQDRAQFFVFYLGKFLTFQFEQLEQVSLEFLDDGLYSLTRSLELIMLQPVTAIRSFPVVRNCIKPGVTLRMSWYCLKSIDEFSEP
jgi:hypothetical protein